MKPAVTNGKTAQPADPVWEMYFENTSSPPQMLMFYEGADAPRQATRPRGHEVARLNKSICAMALALITLKARELRGEFKERRGEERRDVLKSWEPKSWLHTLADTFGRGGNGELGKLFPDFILKAIGVRGGRASNTRIDKDTGKLPSPVCLDCRISDTFPARLRILVNDRAGGPFEAIQDEKKLMELAEKLEDTRGFWDTHLFPLNLNLIEAKATGAAGITAEARSFSHSPVYAKTSHPIARPQLWRELGEAAAFSELKFKFLKLIRAGHEHDCIELIESNPSLCAAKLPPNGDCALINAITYERNLVISYLLDRPDVDVNRANEHGVTPLLKAANINNFNLVKTLVEAKKADCHVANKVGANGIYEAAFGAGHDAFLIIEYFHEKWKVPCDQQINDGFLPLTLAIWRKCDEKTIKYLIEHSRDINVPDFYGDTPYYKAIKYGFFEAVNLLIDLGGAKLDRTKTPSRHLTDRASELFGAVHHGDLKRVKELLKEGNDDIDKAEPEFERSPLHEAVDLGHLQIVEELIAHGADVFIQNNHGRIPRDFLPLKRTATFHHIEDVLKRGEEEWIARELKKLRGKESNL